MSVVPQALTTRLHARSVRIPDPGDLLDHLGSDGFAWLDGDCGFVTSGVAARVDVGDATRLLETVDHVRAAGCTEVAGPRLVGVLPFEGGGELVLPARIVARERDGRAWSTTLDGTDDAPARSSSGTQPARFSVRRGSSPEAWTGNVRRALDAIDRGEVEKVVLARAVDVEADAAFDVNDVLAVLRTTQYGCTVYACDGLVGASPELLVRRRGDAVVARPMAGTGDDPATLLASPKNAHEHRVVVDAIRQTLQRDCVDVVHDGPQAVRLATVTHLATTIRARLTSLHVTALDLVRALHPTPAVGGWPAAPARRLIATLEDGPRGGYAAACGWVDAAGDGEFVVALRCAVISENQARCFAGAGIVAGSEPEAEWAETQAKLQPMLHALVRP